jgi:hypothetical protein
MIVLPLDPDLGHPTGGNVTVEARIRRNACVNNAVLNLGILGGIASNRNRVAVATSHNLFSGRPAAANVRLVGGQNVLGPGSHHNRVTLRSIGDRFLGAAVGLQVEGGALQPEAMSGGFSLAERQSSHNRVTVVLDGAAFEGHDLDIAAYGTISRSNEPGGDHNAVKVVIAQAESPGLTIRVFDCFPEQNFAACSNKTDVR